LILSYRKLIGRDFFISKRFNEKELLKNGRISAGTAMARRIEYRPGNMKNKKVFKIKEITS